MNLDSQLQEVLERHIPNTMGGHEWDTRADLASAIKQIFLDLIGDDEQLLYREVNDNGILMTHQDTNARTLIENDLRATLRAKVEGK